MRSLEGSCAAIALAGLLLAAPAWAAERPAARAAPKVLEHPDVAVPPYVMAAMLNLLDVAITEGQSDIARYLKFRLEELDAFCDRSDWKRVPWWLHQDVMNYFADPYKRLSAYPPREEVLGWWKDSWLCLWSPGEERDLRH